MFHQFYTYVDYLQFKIYAASFILSSLFEGALGKINSELTLVRHRIKKEVFEWIINKQ